MPGLDAWIAKQARFSAGAMMGAISATHLVKDRPGFGQKVIPLPGSVLASPIPAAYDPDPDYFFHWFRDSAIVIDALRIAHSEGLLDSTAGDRFREFVDFSLSLRSLDGREFLRQGDFRGEVTPEFQQYLRDDAEIASVHGDAVLADTRVNPDGTLDFTRWARPQTDGPAMRIIALLQYWDEVASDPALRTAMQKLIEGDIAFTLSRAQDPSFDIWEEESGFHYYTLLVQAEALAQGAEWLAGLEQGDRARECRAAAGEIASRLEAFWDGATGYYRSRTGVTEGESGKNLDIAVILAVNHAGLNSGTHSILDPRAQATLTALEDLFEAEYAINRNRPSGRGPALGRYATDKYYSGGAYFFSTLAAAEFYFRLAAALLAGAEMPVTEENRRFLQRLSGNETDSHPLAIAAIRRGDSILETVRAYTLVGGDLSEQFDRTTGAQTSAKHLAWSYAAFITAVSNRARAIASLPG